MGLKAKLFTLNLTVLASTIAAAVLAGYGYLHISGILQQRTPAAGSAVIIMEGEKVLYQSEKFTAVDIKEILMSLSMNEDTFVYKNVSHTLKRDSFGRVYSIITLTPKDGLGGGYMPLIVTVFSVFLLVFLAAFFIAQRVYSRDVISPVVNLQRATANLRRGELDTPITDEGSGEVGELAREIEQLRIELKNSIYYQQKTEGNRRFLITSISHDLKTPVTSIMGYIEGIFDGVAKTEEKKREYLEKALSKTKQINSMIEDLLLFSKLDLNQMPFSMERTSLTRYMEDSVGECSILFERENKRLSIENRADIFVMLDREKFKRVVQNIFDNAAKNMDSGGELKILIRETPARP